MIAVGVGPTFIRLVGKSFEEMLKMWPVTASLVACLMCALAFKALSLTSLGWRTTLLLISFAISLLDTFGYALMSQEDQHHLNAMMSIINGIVFFLLPLVYVFMAVFVIVQLPRFRWLAVTAPLFESLFAFECWLNGVLIVGLNGMNC